jgi:hypothetical protein
MIKTKTAPSPLRGPEDALAQLAHKAGHLIGAHRAVAVTVAGALVALVVVGWAWSALVGRRALARRQGLVLVPTEGFDPGVEEVLRFAAALAGCRPARLAPRWSRAVRVHLSSARGQLAYSIEGAPWLLPVLRSGTFSQVELRPSASLAAVPTPAGGPVVPDASLEAPVPGAPPRQPTQEDQTVDDYDILAQ